jgi:hypothetical protein
MEAAVPTCIYMHMRACCVPCIVLRAVPAFPCSNSYPFVLQTELRSSLTCRWNGFILRDIDTNPPDMDSLGSAPDSPGN